jgi:hypothetical protein
MRARSPWARARRSVSSSYTFSDTIADCSAASRTALSAATSTWFSVMS